MAARLADLLGGVFRGAPRARRAVVILGMHRSGTSVTTNLLHQLGLRLDAELVPPAPDNPRGFWESRRIVDLHERLLATLRRSWKDSLLLAPLPDRWWLDPGIQPIRAALLSVVRSETQADGIWGFKDPRTARLLPLWRDIFAEARVEPVWVLVFRHPAAVVRSLAARNRMDPALAELLWIEHNLDALDQVGAAGTIAVDFDRLARETSRTLDDLLQRLRRHGMRGLGAADSARIARAAFDPGLVHCRPDGAESCSRFACLIHDHLTRMAESPRSSVSWPGEIASAAVRDIAALIGRIGADGSVPSGGAGVKAFGQEPRLATTSKKKAAIC